MMAPEEIVRELGGGIPAIVILALAIAVAALWRRNQSIQDGRLNDVKDANKAHADLSREVNRTLDALTQAIRGRDG